MRTPRALAIAAGAVCVCLWGQLDHAPEPPPPTLACAPAITLAGHLVCGEPGLAVARTLCGGPAPRAGDTLAPWDGCARGRMPGEQLLALGVPIDINSAGLAELESLPGVGPTLAGRIVVARPFARIDELRRVPGIGPARLANLRRHVVAEPSAGPNVP